MTRVSIYYFFEFLASSAFNGFISLFYRTRGMSMGRLSVLMAAAPLTAFVALPLWGTLCDRAAKRNTVHITVLFLSGLKKNLHPAEHYAILEKRASRKGGCECETNTGNGRACASEGTGIC